MGPNRTSQLALRDTELFAGSGQRWGAWDWAAGEAEFRRSIELNPNTPLPRAGYSHLLAFTLRPAEALEQIDKAIELDPFNLIVRSFYAGVLLNVDRYADALTEAENVLRQAPNHVVALTVNGAALFAVGRYAEALEVAREQAQLRGASQVVAAIDSANSFEEAMRKAAACWAALAQTSFVSPILIAQLYAYRDDRERALEWLERAFETHNQGIPYIGVVPAWDLMHDDPRFQRILQQINLLLP